MLGGCVVAVAAFLLVRSSDEAEVVHRFDVATADRLDALRGVIARAEDDVAALGVLVEADEAWDPVVLRAVARRLVERHPATRLLEWAPWVPGGDRHAMEEATRATTPDFQIRELGADGRPRPAGDRPAYAPVTVAEPASHTEVIGYDLLSTPGRRSALELARSQGVLAATAPLQLLRGGTGVLLARWVSRPERGRSGFVVGVYGVRELVEGALGSLSPEGIELEVTDPSAHAERRLLFATSDETGPARLAPALQRTAPLRIGDRTWFVRFQPSRALASRARTWRPWVALAVCLITTAAIAVVVGGRVRAARRRAAEARRESEQRLALLVDRSPLGVVELDRWGEIVAWNGTAARLFGYSEEEVLRCHFTLLLPEERRADAAERWRRFVAGEVVLRSWSWDTVKRDGARMHCDFHAGRLDGPGGAGAVLLVADVTERRRAEQERRRLWQAVEASPVAVLITDPAGRIEYVNPAFERMSGYPAASAVGERPSILRSGAHDAAFYADMWRRALGGEVWTGEICNRRRTGELYWVHATIGALRDEAGAVTSFVSFQEDVTARRAAAAELERARSRAEEAARAKSAFLAAMSHEIRTPLNAVLGHAQLTVRDPSLGPAAREHLAVIERSGEHLLALLNEVLEMSKLEAGRVSARLEPFDLTALLAEVTALFGPRARERGLAFAVERAPGLPARLLSDAAKIRQVLSNLVGNALKFTEAGRVTLRVRVVPGVGDAALVAIEVVDTGPGIAPAELPLLFREFQQTESGARVRNGTGLGLAISRAYARLLGGDVTAESALGRGSTFRFTFEARVLAGPVEVQLPAEEPAAPAAAPGPLALPDDVVQALRDASRRGDFDAVHGVLDRLAPEQPAAAERLRAAARRFDGPTLLSIIGAQPRPEA